MLECKTRKVIKKVVFVVVDARGSPILGSNTCVDFGLLVRRACSINLNYQKMMICL